MRLTETNFNALTVQRQREALSKKERKDNVNAYIGRNDR
jgi:hypothetical protein